MGPLRGKSVWWLVFLKQKDAGGRLVKNLYWLVVVAFGCLDLLVGG